MGREEEAIKSGLVRPRVKAECGKVKHQTVAEAYLHAVSIALKNDGRARVYVVIRQPKPLQIPKKWTEVEVNR